MVVDDIETIQRRKQSRFEVNFPCRFALIDEDKKNVDVLANPLGSGKVTDISLGGVEFETEMELPTGVLIKLDVRPPNGRLEFVGLLVKDAGENQGMRTYGVKIDAMDTVSLKNLNRLVLRLERQVRRQHQPSTFRPASRIVTERRYMREHGRRRIR